MLKPFGKLKSKPFVLLLLGFAAITYLSVTNTILFFKEGLPDIGNYIRIHDLGVIEKGFRKFITLVFGLAMFSHYIGIIFFLIRIIRNKIEATGQIYLKVLTIISSILFGISAFGFIISLIIADYKLVINSFIPTVGYLLILLGSLAYRDGDSDEIDNNDPYYH